MTDLINQQLSRMAFKEQLSIEVLQRYFRIHHKITLSKEALVNRLRNMKRK